MTSQDEMKAIAQFAENPCFGIDLEKLHANVAQLHLMLGKAVSIRGQVVSSPAPVSVVVPVPGGGGGGGLPGIQQQQVKVPMTSHQQAPVPPQWGHAMGVSPAIADVSPLAAPTSACLPVPALTAPTPSMFAFNPGNAPTGATPPL